MRNKILIYLLTIFLSFCLILSPYIVFNVSAALPILLCDFDDIVSGLDNFESGYFICNNTGAANNFESYNNYYTSSPNSLKVTGGGSGICNLTTDFSYIGQINFSYKEVNNVDIKFYDFDDNCVLSVLCDTNGQWQVNHIGGPTVVGVAGDDITKRYCLVITHLGTNQFNYSWYDNSYGFVMGVNASGNYADDYTTFSYITMGAGATGTVGWDNMYIDTTYRVPGGNPPEGFLGVNCFNETSGENITDFNVLFVNQEGDVYYDYLVNNTWIVWGDLLPQGECMLTVSKIGYYPRSYLLDVEDGYFVIDGVTYTEVVVNAYLPSINLSALYYIQVIDEYLYPVEDATVRIQGWCGGTEYKNISITNTDGYGLTQVYLCWGTQYQVTIRKEGFVTKTSTWIPDPSQYGSEYPKIFRIYHIGYNLTPEYDPWDYIVFQGWMYNNNTIKVNYEDVVLNGTINATFYTYEINGTSLGSVLISTNNTTNNTFTFWIYNINISRHHRVYLYLNHTILGYIILHIDLSLTNITDNINETDIEDKITDVFGPFDLGYVNFFFVFLPAIFLLVIPGHFHPGIGILSAGLWLGFGSLYFGLPSIITLLAPFLMMIGTLLMIVKGGASKL